MPTTRSEVMAALELAALIVPAIDTAANYREPFVELMGLDPGLVERGRGRRAARILTGVLAALREERDNRGRYRGPTDGTRVMEDVYCAAGSATSPSASTGELSHEK
jgi:hypothetical protein